MAVTYKVKEQILIPLLKHSPRNLYYFPYRLLFSFLPSISCSVQIAVLSLYTHKAGKIVHGHN
jgi:hypothetical protein